MFRILLPVLLLFAMPANAAQAREHGVSPETVLALKGLQSLDQRMNAVGFRLVSANEPFCKTKTYRAGLSLHDIEQYGDKDAARAAFGFSGEVAINAIAPESPASRTGLLAGDILSAINGKSVNDVSISIEISTAESAGYKRIAAINALLSDALRVGKAKLTIQRAAVEHQIQIIPVRSCNSRFQIKVSEKRSASADGKIVSVSSALATYVLDDEELAAIVAHELAHNLLDHRTQLNAQKVNRGFFGQFGKSARRIKTTEIEADRLSIWLMVNAGYDPEAAIRFWTRYGKEHGKGIFSASTHYRWKKRVKLLAAEIARMKTVEAVNAKWQPPLLTDLQ